MEENIFTPFCKMLDVSLFWPYDLSAALLIEVFYRPPARATKYPGYYNNRHFTALKVID